MTANRRNLFPLKAGEVAILPGDLLQTADLQAGSGCANGRNWLLQWIPFTFNLECRRFPVRFYLNLIKQIATKNSFIRKISRKFGIYCTKFCLYFATQTKLLLSVMSLLRLILFSFLIKLNIFLLNIFTIFYYISLWIVFTLCLFFNPT